MPVLVRELMFAGEDMERIKRINIDFALNSDI